jgi:hypothetical protein
MAGEKKQRALVSTVHVVDGGGLVHVYGPGDTVPAEHAKLITNPKAWGGDAPEPEVTEEQKQGSSDAGKQGTGEKPPVKLEKPPVAGQGSGEKAWKAFADQEGIEYPADAKKDDIVALVAAREGQAS